MLWAFRRPPRILRLFGTGTTHALRTDRYAELTPRCAVLPGSRATVDLDIERIHTWCGFAVPFLDYRDERPTLQQWSARKGPGELAAYWSVENATSIDGLLALDVADVADVIAAEQPSSTVTAPGSQGWNRHIAMEGAPGVAESEEGAYAGRATGRATPSADGARRSLEANELVICLGVRVVRSPDVVLMAQAAGFDGVFIDLEHSALTLESVAAMCTTARAAGGAALVRVPPGRHDLATRALDAGASGVVFPHVNTRREAEELVDRCRLPPVGTRSTAGIGPTHGYRTMSLAEANRCADDALCIAMIETPQAVAEVEAIAATPGIDGLLVGCSDLSTELGIPGELRDQRLLSAVAAVADACRANGRHLGIGGGSGDDVMLATSLALGARLLVAAFDTTYLMRAASDHAAAMRARLAEVAR